jgi:hypothetical protein
MSKIVDSVQSAVNQAANELIDKKVTTKLSDAGSTIVSSAFAIVEDVLKIVRDETQKTTTQKTTTRSQR